MEAFDGLLNRNILCLVYSQGPIGPLTAVSRGFHKFLRSPSFASDALICRYGHSNALEVALAASPEHMKQEIFEDILSKVTTDDRLDDKRVLHCAARDGQEKILFNILRSRMARQGTACGGDMDAALEIAAKNNRFGAVCLLLGRHPLPSMQLGGGSIVRTDAHNSAALAAAAEAGHTSIVRLLVDPAHEHPARPDANDCMALLLACQGQNKVNSEVHIIENIEVVKLLVKGKNGARRDCRNGAVLVAAAINGSAALIRLLTDHTTPHAAVANHNQGEALIFAAMHGNDDAVLALLDCTVDAPTPGMNDSAPLLAAVQGGCKSTVRLLLDYASADSARADAQMGRVLLWAIHIGNCEVAELLLASDFPPEITWDSLDMAHRSGNEEMIKLLQPLYITSNAFLELMLPLPDLRASSSDDDEAEEI